MCFNEIKTDPEKLEERRIKDYVPLRYKHYWNCCTRRKGYSGTAVFTKVEPLKVQYGLGIENLDNEGRSMTLEFEHFVLIAVYVPNSGQNLERLSFRVEEWDVAFHDHIKEQRDKSGKPVILIGDLNVAHQPIDIFDPERLDGSACYTKQERSSFQSFLNSGFVDVYRHLYPKTQQFTIWSHKSNSRSINKGWRLDYAIIDKDHLPIVVDTTIHSEYYGSDHCPVRLMIDLTRTEDHGLSLEDLQRAIND